MSNKKLDLDKLHVVYFSILYPEIYICPNAFKAKLLVRAYERLNKLTNRNFIKIVTGSCSEVFTYKIPEFINIVFTWEASQKDRQKVFGLIADAPLKAR